MGSTPPPHRGPESFRTGSPPEPEILPPDGYAPPPRPEVPYAPPPPPPPPMPPKRRRGWALAPGTYTLVGINCAVFLLMTLQGINPLAPSSEALFRWGADNAGAVLYYGQWWRIVTAMFVHGGILHLGLNMWCLWNLGMLAEPLMGTFGVTSAYLLTGAGGNLLSTLWNWKRYSSGAVTGLFGPVGVGASGAVFGIAGALIILLKSPRLPVPPQELHKIRRSVIYFAAINLFLGLAVNVGASRTGVAVDNGAHLGGFVTGLLFAAPMVPRLGWPRETFITKRRIAVGVVTGVLVLFGFFISVLAG